MKDKRYKAIAALIQGKQISTFHEIFDVIPLTVVKDDTGLNYSTLHRKKTKVQLLTLEDVEKLAAVFEVDMMDLLAIIVAEMKKKSRKSPVKG